ncbi:UvrD-helicase domain-containing protein [Nocardiopsis tropica]|uniref:DNA 3'-5' helicase n=1 Tax=Nocardiopsis tropica TaxID=109330 RepID=A0ABV2A2B8_9ACTN
MNASDPLDELTDEQRAVVEQPADAQVLVTAGPGAGKTHTLIRRLDFLVSEEEVGPGEILVLTFSRAAVRELRARTITHGGSARHVRAQTFDSWALDLLMKVDAGGGWEERSFDARIEGARRAIEDGLAEEELGGDLVHVVIDEVQDLVGPRREMVEVLLDEFDPGFTVVGDPAQSIYGFTVPDVEQRAQETGRFFTWVRRTFGEDLIELRLTSNFRACTAESGLALPHGPELRRDAESGRVAGPGIHEELRGSLRTTLSLDMDEFGFLSLGSHEGTTAVLCRTNGQALLLSGSLWQGGVHHRLQRSARDRSAPAWLAFLFRKVDGSILTRSRFEEVVSAYGLPVDEVEPLWLGLRRSARDGARNVDMGRLRTAMALGRLADELTAQPPASLVVSSFHRAKGLEFDRVVVVDPGSLPVGEQKSEKGGRKKRERHVDVAEEARLLYVAMTRPRQELLHMDPPEQYFVRSAPGLDRWGRYSFRRWARLGLELHAGDVCTEFPAGTHGFTEDPQKVQEYLATGVRQGDEVRLERLLPDSDEPGRSPHYVVVHQERPIGMLSDRLRSDLYHFMKLGPSYEPRNWPCLLSGVRIDSVEASAGSEAAGLRAGLGSRGVWLTPRLTGLSTFEYDPKPEEENHDDST